MKTTETEGTARQNLTTTQFGTGSLPALSREIATTDLVPLDDYTDQQRRAVAQIAQSVSLTDTVSTEFFGAPPLKRLSDQLDRTLSGVRVDEMGDEGARLVTGIRDDFKILRLDDVKKEIVSGEGFLAKLPLIGKVFSAFQHMRQVHEQVLKNLDKRKQDGEILLGKLKGVISTSDNQYQATEDAIDEFALWLAGGQQAWLRMRDEYRGEVQAATGSNDLKRLARLRDMAEGLDSFAANLIELRIAHLGFIASLPQIRMTQKAARIEVQNTLRSIFLDLPRIKQSVRTLASLRQIAKASDSAKAQKAMAQDLAKLSADLTGVVYTNAIASEGDFDSGVQTIDYVMNSVVGTLDKALTIREENVGKREAATKALDESYAKFVSSLRSTAARGLAR